MKNEPVLVSYKLGSWFQPKDLHRHTPQLATEHALPYPGRPIGSLCGEIPPRVVGNIFSAHTGISLTPRGMCEQRRVFLAVNHVKIVGDDIKNSATSLCPATCLEYFSASAIPRSFAILAADSAAA